MTGGRNRGGNTSLLMGAAPEMFGGPSDFLANPESKNNRLQFKMGNPSRFGNNQQNFKPLVQFPKEGGLNNALNMDSDEEDIVNMGKEEERKPAPKPRDDEELPQFAFVRRSTRLSNISRNKSDISAKAKDAPNDFLYRSQKYPSPDARIGQGQVNDLLN